MWDDQCEYDEYCNPKCFLLECDKYNRYGAPARGTTCSCTMDKPRTCAEQLECGSDAGLCLKG